MSQLLVDADGVRERLEKMADALAGMIEHPGQSALIGIRTRGAVLAQRLQALIEQRKGWQLPLGILDITLYRDDLSQLDVHPIVRHTKLEFDVPPPLGGVIDDVLYTGRTIRSALDEITDFGRPRAIRLAVMVDRGLREFPIQADFAALTVPTVPEQVVKVCLDETDGEDKILLTQRAPAISR